MLASEYYISDFEFISSSAINMLSGMRVNEKDTKINTFEKGKTFKIDIESDIEPIAIKIGW